MQQVARTLLFADQTWETIQNVKQRGGRQVQKDQSGVQVSLCVVSNAECVYNKIICKHNFHLNSNILTKKTLIVRRVRVQQKKI